MEKDPQGAVAQAVETGISVIYDRVAVKKDSVLKAAAQFHGDFGEWEQYQKRAGLALMDKIADAHIRNTKFAVSGLGAAAGFGGFLTIIPDTLQFITLTLRMVTGIAAAYGVDPDPYLARGRGKVLVMQAYLNANIGHSAKKGIEAVTLTTTTKLLRNAAQRSELLLKIIVILARLIGLRFTESGLLKAIPVVSSGANAGFNWFYCRKIAIAAKSEFRKFREEIRSGKHRGDPDFGWLGNQ
jgi:hypothetical protein